MNLLRANLLALGLIIIVACSGSSDTNEQTQPQAASVIRVTGIPDENPTDGGDR